ncbi:CSLREA domain-containing protein [bacterium]|nr:CSLREA domain-containing protein [bacterium]
MRTKMIAILITTLFVAVSSQAAVFVVNSFNDAVDVSIGNGVCLTAASECTLRAAIQEANFADDADTIDLPAGLYTLTIPGADEDMAVTGDLDILHTVTIHGAAGATTQIDGNGVITQDRVFEIHGDDVQVYLLKVTGGGVTGDGGCIRNTANLVFESGEISDCHANGSSGFGGAINSTNGSTLQMEFVTVVNNNATNSGGGLSISGSAQIYKVTFAENTGGVIRNTGDLEITASKFSDNQSTALLNIGNADIELTAFYNNSSTQSAGAIANLGTLNMRNCTISGNSSNIATGGIDSALGTATLNNVTITGNSGTTSGGVDSQGGVNLQNTILALNLNNGQPSDCSGTISSSGHNLVGSLNGCNIAGDETGNIYNQDPHLSQLEDMGGSSPLHLLQQGSPAFDAGDDATCEALDQRELARPQFASCDIGSAEAQTEFTLHLVPDTVTTDSGQNAVINVEITSYFGFNSQITLNCINLPAGMSCSFNPNQVTPPANGIVNSTLTINPGNNPEGIYTFNVVGVGGAVFQSKLFTLIISDSIYSDDFEDNDVSDWRFTKGNWSASGGELKGTVVKKGDALSPDFGKCSECAMEADIRIDSTNARVSLLAWYEDKRNLVEIRLMEDKNKVLLKHRSGGLTIAKQKALLPIDPGVNYNVRVYFDGYNIQVYVNDALVILISANAVPNGNVGFRVKSASGLPVSASFEEVRVD